MPTNLRLTAPLAPKDAVAALILLDDGRYLMQERDDIQGIFYPGYWGLFGGAIDKGENAEDALVREIREELGYDVKVLRYFTKVAFDFEFAGIGLLNRSFFEVDVATASLPRLELGEGRALGSFTADEVLSEPRIVPYDAFALWQHINRDLITA